MRKLSSGVVAMMFFAMTAACGGQPSNLLIGTWKVDRSGAAQSAYCQEPISFAEKSRTMPPGAQGGQNTIPVTYVTGDVKTFPRVVYVMTDAGIEFHTTYRFLSKDKMILDTAPAMRVCEAVGFRGGHSGPSRLLEASDFAGDIGLR